jgi:hypothetical protein
MKYTQIFKKMIASGWYENREIILDSLPHHLEELPDNVKKFLKEIWYLTISYDAYYRSNGRIFLSTVLHNFGETINTLVDYSIDDEDYIFYQKSIGKKLRNFALQITEKSLLMNWEEFILFLILEIYIIWEVNFMRDYII